jgi:hypothetical protein
VLTPRLLAPYLALLVCGSVSAAEPPPADTRSVTDRIKELKPAAADPADPPVRKLQKERFNARLGAAKIQLAARQAGAAAPLDLTAVVDRLALDGAELEDKPADRVKWLRLRVDALKDQERLAKAQAKQGGILELDALLITAARADAEIDLIRLQDSLNQKK